MAVQAADLIEEPVFGLGDRLEKSRRWCGIKSAEDMAARLTAKLGAHIKKPIKGSTVSAWEAGTNQPTTVRLEDLVEAWIDVCNEAGAPLGHATSAAFIYGIRTGSFSSDLIALPEPTGQGQLLGNDLEPLDFFSKPELCSV